MWGNPIPLLYVFLPIYVLHARIILICYEMGEVILNKFQHNKDVFFWGKIEKTGVAKNKKRPNMCLIFEKQGECCNNQQD